MDKNFAESVLKLYQELAKIKIELPENYSILNPFNGANKEQVYEISSLFYKKFYDDNEKRFMILGSSPARRGSAITGVPFEDADHLFQETNISINKFYVNKSSSNFLYDVINSYGGCEKFYKKFYMNFVCPVGIVKTNPNGNAVNCNYYETKQLKTIFKPLIVHFLKEQLKFNLDTSICFCLGSGENYQYLTDINNEFHFFDNIIPLEHPRYIMQYHSKDKDMYLQKYLKVLSLNKTKGKGEFNI